VFGKSKSDILNIKVLTRMDRGAIESFYDRLSTESLNYYDVRQTSKLGLMNSLSGCAGSKRNYGVFLNGELVGLSVMWDYDKSVPWFSIIIADDMQGKGIGRRLLEYNIRMAQNDQKGGILLTTHITNIRAQSLYVHSGFERLGVHSTGEELYIKRF